MNGAETSRNRPDPTPPAVGVVMGSRTDLEHLAPAADLLESFGIPHEVRLVSAHRTPEWMAHYARTARSRGIKVIIAGAGGAAHLPGMLAANTTLPVLGVPVPATALSGLDALMSIVQMPKGVPVGTLAIGRPGAMNAGLLALSILALSDADLAERLEQWRRARERDVLDDPMCAGDAVRWTDARAESLSRLLP